MNIARLLLFSTTLTCPMNASDKNPIPIEVWRGGDDGLTLRLADALENAFKASPHFILSSGRKKGTLVVRIPTHVGWKQIGKRTRVLYNVEFASADDQNVGGSTGSCWEDALTQCAAEVVNKAGIAARVLSSRVAKPNLS